MPRVKPHIDETASPRSKFGLLTRQASVHITYDDATDTIGFEEREDKELGDELSAFLWKAAHLAGVDVGEDATGSEDQKGDGKMEVIHKRDAYKHVKKDILVTSLVPTLTTVVLFSILLVII